MMVCTQCGFQNENEDAFCGSCGAFLEWAGEKVGMDGPAAPATVETESATAEVPAPPAEPAVEDAAPAGFPPGPTSTPRREQAAPPEADVSAEAAAASPGTEGGTGADVIDLRPEPAPPEPAQAERAPAAAGPDRMGGAPEVEEPDARGPGLGAAAAAQAGAASPPRPGPPAETGKAAATEAAEGRTGGPTVTTGTSAPDASRVRAQAPAAPPARPPTRTPPARTPGAAPSPGPVARRPDAVKPSGAKPRPVPSKPPPRREIRPGDLVCKQCQEGNDPHRRFCRRCGASLVEAVEAVPPPPLPWWKRLFVRQPKVVAAGERPMRRGGSGTQPDLRSRLRQLRRVAALLAVLGIGVGFVGPWRSSVRNLFQGARESVVPKLSQVNPVSAEASSSLNGHPPTMAIDRVFGQDNFWAEGAKGDGVGQRLIVNFEPPIRLGQVGFRLGVSGNDFVTQPRPSKVRLHLSNGSTKDLTLRDTAEFQTHAVDARDTGRLEIEILEVFKSTQGGSDCAIADIEFFQRS